nr:copper resistance CopC family protein [uncultured Rhodopila sp.]
MRPQLATLIAAAACPVGHAALAHGHPEQSSPAVNSGLAAPPTAVTITFSEGAEPRFSTVLVQDAQGGQIDKTDRLSTGGNDRQLSVRLPNPGAGTPRRWILTEQRGVSLSK